MRPGQSYKKALQEDLRKDDAGRKTRVGPASPHSKFIEDAKASFKNASVPSRAVEHAKSMPDKIETVDQQFGAGGGQKAKYHHTFKMGPHKMRVSIEADNHKPQGHARIERFDGNQWNEIHHLKTDEMKTADGYGAPGGGKLPHSHFKADEDRLIAGAKKILE